MKKKLFAPLMAVGLLVALPFSANATTMVASNAIPVDGGNIQNVQSNSATGTGTSVAVSLTDDTQGSADDLLLVAISTDLPSTGTITPPTDVTWDHASTPTAYGVSELFYAQGDSVAGGTNLTFTLSQSANWTASISEWTGLSPLPTTGGVHGYSIDQNAQTHAASRTTMNTGDTGNNISQSDELVIGIMANDAAALPNSGSLTSGWSALAEQTSGSDVFGGVYVNLPTTGGDYAASETIPTAADVEGIQATFIGDEQANQGLVQRADKSCFSSCTASPVDTLDHATRAGSLLAVGVTWEGAQAISSMDSGPGTAVLGVSKSNSNGNINSAVYYYANANSVSSVQVNFSAAPSALFINVSEFAGMNPSTPNYQSDTATYTSGTGTVTTFDMGSLAAPTQPNNVVYGVGAMDTNSGLDFDSCENGAFNVGTASGAGFGGGALLRTIDTSATQDLQCPANGAAAHSVGASMALAGDTNLQQSTQASDTTTATSQSAAWPSTTFGGDLLVAVATAQGGPTITCPTGYTSAASVTGEQICYNAQAASVTGGTSVTFTLSVAEPATVTLMEFADVRGASPLDKTGTNTSGASLVSTMDTGATATTSQNNEISVGAVWNNSGEAPTGLTGSQYDTLGEDPLNSSNWTGVYWSPLTVASAQEVTQSLAVAAKVRGAIATFKI